MSARRGSALLREAVPIPEDAARGAGWTEAMGELADWIGEAATLKLCEAFGGVPLYIPVAPPPDIVAVIGAEAARVLCETYGREMLTLPCAKAALLSARLSSMLNAIRGGQISLNEAALRLGTSARYVRQQLNTPKLGARNWISAATRARQLDLLGSIED